VYERAGVIRTRNGDTGSLTIVGTVSPAGGNFEEPVTQSTLGTVKTFLGLSYDRAYKRFYPAIDPLISWSRYLEQLREHFQRNLSPGWAEAVGRIRELLEQGDEVFRMMQVTGEEGVTLEDFVTYQKALLVDMVYLQQDAFDPVDVSMPHGPPEGELRASHALHREDYRFEDKEQAREFFTRVTNAFKNLNYSETDSDAFRSYMADLQRLSDEYV
jgi:V/A-type H+-transporting ATPase subunit A